jgi:hypothetical protein
MIESIINLLVVFLVLILIYWMVGKFITGTPLQVIGIILGLIFLLYALNLFGVMPHGGGMHQPLLR